MDDLRDRMEQLARRVDGAAAPDLVDARERLTRRRTRSALVVGLSVAVLGTVLAASALRTPPEAPGPVASPWGLPAVPLFWPPEGTPSEEWQEDPQEVVRRFAQMVLGWSDPGLRTSMRPSTPRSPVRSMS